MQRLIQYKYNIGTEKKQGKSDGFIVFYSSETETTFLSYPSSGSPHACTRTASLVYAYIFCAKGGLQSRKTLIVSLLSFFFEKNEGDRLALRTARLGRSRSQQSTGLSLCTAPPSIPLALFTYNIQKKHPHFCKYFSLVEMRGIDSRRELRASVIRGHDSPPDCRSVPLLLRSPSPFFANNKQKKKHLLFCKYFSLVEMRSANPLPLECHSSALPNHPETHPNAAVISLPLTVFQQPCMKSRKPRRIGA